MKQALLMAVLLAVGAVVAHFHVIDQHYYPVVRLASSDGYVFDLVQDRTDTRKACGEANDRFLQPIKEACPQCEVVYARCDRELDEFAFKLVSGEPVPLHVVSAPGLRLAVAGPAATIRRDCELIARLIVQSGVEEAGCANPGTARRPHKKQRALTDPAGPASGRVPRRISDS